MQLYFIRHAQSLNNLLWDQTGSDKGRSCDPELTDLGYRQAAVLADFLQRANPCPSVNGRDPQNVVGFCITHLYTSLMVRAVATALIVAEKLNLMPVAWLDLHEGGGIYLSDEAGNPVGQPGHNRAYFEERFPRLVLPDALDAHGWWNRPYEAHEERPLRARRVIATLLERHGGTADRVALISHGGFYNHLLAALLNLPVRQDLWFVLNNTAITRIDFTDEGMDVVYMNRLDFLPDELIT